MIDPRELRLGNWLWEESDTENLDLYPERDPWQVAVINSIDGCIRNTKDEITTFECIHGIPLTPEILEKCGFYAEGNIYAYNRFEVYYNDQLGDFRYNRCDGFATSLYYLHHLQNLFFALSGEELNYQP